MFCLVRVPRIATQTPAQTKPYTRLSNKPHTRTRTHTPTPTHAHTQTRINGRKPTQPAAHLRKDERKRIKKSVRRRHMSPRRHKVHACSAHTPTHEPCKCTAGRMRTATATPQTKLHAPRTAACAQVSTLSATRHTARLALTTVPTPASAHAQSTQPAHLRIHEHKKTRRVRRRQKIPCTLQAGRPQATRK
jgi:hypothetical protein